MYVRRFTNSSWEEISYEDYLNAVEWAGSHKAFVEIRNTPPDNWVEEETMSVYEELLLKFKSNFSTDYRIKLLKEAQFTEDNQIIRVAMARIVKRILEGFPVSQKCAKTLAAPKLDMAASMEYQLLSPGGMMDDTAADFIHIACAAITQSTITGLSLLIDIAPTLRHMIVTRNALRRIWKEKNGANRSSILQKHETEKNNKRKWSHAVALLFIEVGIQEALEEIVGKNK